MWGFEDLSLNDQSILSLQLKQEIQSLSLIKFIGDHGNVTAIQFQTQQVSEKLNHVQQPWNSSEFMGSTKYDLTRIIT